MNDSSSSPVYERVVNAYMDLLSQPHLTRATIGDICQKAGASRSTFYQYFESLSDLDQRFMSLFFQRFLRRVPDEITSSGELLGFYTTLVDTMRTQSKFFRALGKDEGLAAYRFQWQEEIAEWIRTFFARSGIIVSDDALWKFHVEMALGTVFQFIDLSMRLTKHEEIEWMAKSMIEYQIGGLLRLRDRDRFIPIDEKMVDKALKYREQRRKG